MAINMRRTTDEEKEFLRSVDDRLEALGKPKKQRQRLKRLALAELRQVNSNEEHRLTRGFAKQHVKGKEAKYRASVPDIDPAE